MLLKYLSRPKLCYSLFINTKFAARYEEFATTERFWSPCTTHFGVKHLWNLAWKNVLRDRNRSSEIKTNCWATLFPFRENLFRKPFFDLNSQWVLISKNNLQILYGSERNRTDWESFQRNKLSPQHFPKGIRGKKLCHHPCYWWIHSSSLSDPNL